MNDAFPSAQKQRIANLVFDCTCPIDLTGAGRGNGNGGAQGGAEQTRALLVDFMSKFDTGADGNLSADAILDEIHAEDSVRCMTL